jgi:hypothetical protein
MYFNVNVVYNCSFQNEKDDSFFTIIQGFMGWIYQLVKKKLYY